MIGFLNSCKSTVSLTRLMEVSLKNAVSLFAASVVSSLSLNAVSLAQEAKYVIDASHSKVGFEVSHLVISTVEGQFDKVEGEFTFDPSDFTKTSLMATAETKSVNTANKKRDDHLRADDFFDAKKFPKITFKSKKAEKTGEKTFKLTGDFTMKDVTKEVVFDVTYKGTVKGFQGPVVAFVGETTINRQDFNVKFQKAVEAGPVVGDEVKIKILAEGMEAKAKK